MSREIELLQRENELLHQKLEEANTTKHFEVCDSWSALWGTEQRDCQVSFLVKSSMLVVILRQVSPTLISVRCKFMHFVFAFRACMRVSVHVCSFVRFGACVRITKASPTTQVQDGIQQALTTMGEKNDDDRNQLLARLRTLEGHADKVKLLFDNVSIVGKSKLEVTCLCY